MAKRDLKQYMRGEDGVLYAPGKGVDIPKTAGLQLPKPESEDETKSTGETKGSDAEENAKKVAAMAEGKKSEGKK